MLDSWWIQLLLGVFPSWQKLFILRQEVTNIRLMFSDTCVHQTNLSPSLLFLLGNTTSSCTTLRSKASHRIGAMYFTSLYSMIWDSLLLFRTPCLYYRGGETCQAICYSASQFTSSLQRKAVIMSSLDFCFSLHNYSRFNLPLKFMFPWPWIMLSDLCQTFFNHSMDFLIQRLKFRLRSFSCPSLLFICLPSW